MSTLASQGIAIIMISSELPEILGMSDRILIYHEGKTNGIIERADILSGKITQQDIIAKEFGQ
jgi:ribose transport system ATP-binding protein/inositol transport system ATP-binding protein